MEQLEDVIKDMGGPTEFGRLLDVSPQVVNNWLARRVPIERCADIERVTGGRIKRVDLYPEHFGPISKAAA